MASREGGTGLLIPISLMRTGPAGHFGELAAALGSAMMIVGPSRRIARGR